MVSMGSQLEGYIRNTIGRNAEKLIKEKILDWLIPNEIVNMQAGYNPLVRMWGVLILFHN